MTGSVTSAYTGIMGMLMDDDDGSSDEDDVWWHFIEGLKGAEMKKARKMMAFIDEALDMIGPSIDDVNMFEGEDQANVVDIETELRETAINEIREGESGLDIKYGIFMSLIDHVTEVQNKERKEEIIITTKAGRRLDPHNIAGYNNENITNFVERSLKNLDVDALDLLQLHCPPTELYYMPEKIEILDELVKEGKIRYYGVSVEKVEEALKAIEYPNVQSVQIILICSATDPQNCSSSRQKSARLAFSPACRWPRGC